MVEHHRAQDNVKLGIRERHLFDYSLAKGDLHARFSRFLFRPRKHLWRSIHAVDLARSPDPALRRNRKGSGATTDIQHGFTRRDEGEIQRPLAKLALFPTHKEPHNEVIERWRVQHDPARG